MTCRLNLGDVYLDGIFVLFSDHSFFTSRSVVFPMRLKIPRESFLVFPTLSTLYALLGELGSDLAGGVVDGIALYLVSEVGAGDGGLRGPGGQV